MWHVALFCESDAVRGFPSSHRYSMLDHLRSFFARSSEISRESIPNIMQDVIQLFPEREEFQQDDAFDRYTIAIAVDLAIAEEKERYRQAATADRTEALALLKQDIRDMLFIRDKVVHPTAWTTIDSMDGYGGDDNPGSCADIMYISGAKVYNPPLPPRFFDACVLRLCDPYVDLVNHIIPSLRPGAILVFEGLRGLVKKEELSSDPWDQDSQVHGLVEDGVLQIASVDYTPPRSLPRKRWYKDPSYETYEQQKPTPITTFVYTPTRESLQEEFLESLKHVRRSNPQTSLERCREFQKLPSRT